MHDNDEKLIRALRFVYATTHAADDMVDSLCEAAEEHNLNLSDEARAALDRLYLALNGFVDDIRDMHDLIEASHIVAGQHDHDNDDAPDSDADVIGAYH